MRLCRVLEVAWLQEEAKAHFATALPFRITIESDELAEGGMVSFTESYTRIGNAGPRTVWPELQNGPSIPQVTASHTNVTIIQSGEAISFGGWPTGNPPGLPTAFLDNPTETTARFISYADIRPLYTTRWNYVYTFNYDQALPFPLAS
jgi:hypothetical protein